MADEATINSSLQIKVGKLEYQNRPTSFTADVSVAGGPTPGQILVTTAGIDITLTELATPGLCRFMNLDTTNFVSVGVFDTSNFFPLLALLAGESFVMRLATDVEAGANTLRFKADTASVNVLIEVFEK